MTSRRFSSILAINVLGASLSAVGATSARAQNLIKDGGFEVPHNGNALTFGVGQMLGNWIVVGDDSGTVQTFTKASKFDGIKFVAQSGKQFVDLTGSDDQGTATGVAQTVHTVTGTTYNLTFWVGNANYVNTPEYGTASTVNVYLGSTLLLSANNSLGAGRPAIVWQQFTASFVAAGNKTTLSFINGDPSHDIMNGLDSVSLAPASN